MFLRVLGFLASLLSFRSQLFVAWRIFRKLLRFQSRFIRFGGAIARILPIIVGIAAHIDRSLVILTAFIGVTLCFLDAVMLTGVRFVTFAHFPQLSPTQISRSDTDCERKARAFPSVLPSQLHAIF